jgi:hypothetical protein
MGSGQGYWRDKEAEEYLEAVSKDKEVVISKLVDTLNCMHFDEVKRIEFLILHIDEYRKSLQRVKVFEDKIKEILWEEKSMILFEHNGRKFKLLFRYGYDYRDRRCVVAFVCEQGKNMPVLFEGISRCSLEDNFCKETGRRVALQYLEQDVIRKNVGIGDVSGFLNRLTTAYMYRGKKWILNANSAFTWMIELTWPAAVLFW